MWANSLQDQKNRLDNFLPQLEGRFPLARIFLFGEPRLEVDARTITLPPREGLISLFVRLVLQPGQVLLRKNLAFALWPDESEAEALANLRRHLYLIRKILPIPLRDLLLITTQSVSWQDSPLCWVDVNEFMQAGESLDALERAAELYRGDLAAGVEGDDFLISRRETLRDQFLAMLRKLANNYIEQRQFDRALEWTRRLIVQNPWDEEAVRLKMILEVQTGNRTAALATYQNLAYKLQRELDTQPMPETMALYSDILHNRLVRPAQFRTAAKSFFVGRVHELEQLSSLFQSLITGQGRVVFISGPAGVGKSALLQESLRRLAEEAGESAPRVLWGFCLPPMIASPSRPYAPWSQILNAVAPLLARSKEISPEWLNHLLPLVPDLALLKSGLLRPAQPNATELHMALRQVFCALALSKPLILVIEDAHWGDELSLEVLQELAETCSSLPLLILVTCRSDELPLPLLRIKRALRQRRCLSEILLHTFDAEETRLFLETVLGEQVLSPVLYDEITYYAKGLPLLLREVAESIRKARGNMSYPLTLREIIEFRLGQLNQQTRDMLETAAILGFSFSDHELRSQLNWPEPIYAAALDSLFANRLLQESVLRGSPEYTFSHQLIHQIILESIPSARAVHLHQQIASTLQQIYAGKNGFAGRIATHYQFAGLPLAAARFWLEHARESTDLAAFDQALQAIERALALLGTDSSLESRELQAQATLQRGVIAYHRGQITEALTLLEEALRQCDGFPSLRAHALSRLAYVLHSCDRYAESLQLAGESLQIARALGDPHAIVRALNIRGMTALMLGHNVDALRDLREALALEESFPQHSAQMVQSLNHLGTALVFTQNYTEASEILAKTIELAQRGGLKRLESAALTMQGQIALNRGQYSQAIEIYNKAIMVAGQSHLTNMWGKYAGRGMAYLRKGHLKEAQADFECGFELARQVESRYGQLLMRVYRAFTSLALGHLPSDSLSALEEEAAVLDLHAVVFQAGLFCAGLWRLAGDWERAAAAHQRSIQAAQSSGVPQFLQNAQLEWLFTQAQIGASDPVLLNSLFRQAQDSAEVPQQVLAKLTLAVMLHAENRSAEALSVAQESLALARSCPDRILTGEVLLFLMRLYHALGQSEQAQTCQAELLLLARTAFAPLHIPLNTSFAADLRSMILA